MGPVRWREQRLHRCPDGIYHFGLECAHDDGYLHQVVGRWVRTRHSNRAIPTTGGWSSYRLSKRVLSLAWECASYLPLCFRKKKAPIMAIQRINIKTIPPNINAAPREIAVTAWPMVPYPLLCRTTHASPIAVYPTTSTISMIVAPRTSSFENNQAMPPIITREAMTVAARINLRAESRLLGTVLSFLLSLPIADRLLDDFPDCGTQRPTYTCADDGGQTGGRHSEKCEYKFAGTSCEGA